MTCHRECTLPLTRERSLESNDWPDGRAELADVEEVPGVNVIGRGQHHTCQIWDTLFKDVTFGMPIWTRNIIIWCIHRPDIWSVGVLSFICMHVFVPITFARIDWLMSGYFWECVFIHYRMKNFTVITALMKEFLIYMYVAFSQFCILVISCDEIVHKKLLKIQLIICSQIQKYIYIYYCQYKM